jgi:hypothetical protein
MSSVDIRFLLSSYKCFIVEKILSRNALLQGIEKKMNLYRLEEGVGLIDKRIAYKQSGFFVTLVSSLESTFSSSLSCS